MRRRLKRRGEGGAVSLIVALVVVALAVPIASMAVDLGMQRVARRDMQAIADLVALDMARHLDGRKFAVIKEANAWENGMRSSIARNLNLSAADEAKLVSGGDKITIVTEDVTFVAQVPEKFVRGREDLVIRVTMGRQDASDGKFEQITDAAKQIPSAVRVTASTAVNMAFSGSRGGATRTAIATSDPLACHKVGSWGADLRTSHSVLGGLLDSIDANLDLEAVHYDHLADAQVTLADVFAGISAGKPDVVLSTLVDLDDFLQVLVTSLPASSPAAEVLTLEIRDVLSTTVAAKQIKLGDIVSLGGDPDIALAGQVNVLDLVQGAFFAANGTNAIAVPGLTATVPGLTNVTVTAHVVQKPQIACGFGSTAETSQISVDLEADLDTSLEVYTDGSVISTIIGSITNPVLQTVGVAGKVRVSARVANAQATLESVACTVAGPQSLAITMQSAPSLANLGAAADVGIEFLTSTYDLAEVQVSSPVGATHGASPYTLSLPSAYETPVRTSTPGVVGVPDLTQAQLKAAGLSLDALLAPVVGLLNPVLIGLETALVNTVLPQLGVQLAGADLYAVRAPDCVAPNLRG